MTAGDAPKTSVRANLLSLRTLFIFAAGFALALLLARLLPEAELFHPEGRMITRDTVITFRNESGDVHAITIATECCGSFPTATSAWDADLLEEVRAHPPTSMRIPARITYVIPREGLYSAVNIRRPD